MKTKLLILLLFLLSPLSIRAEEKAPLAGGGCVKCHADIEDPVVGLWKDDVHAKLGLGCVDCHGGNPNTDDMDEAKAKSTGFIGSPKRVDIPKLCGKCHSNATFMKKYAPLLPTDQLDTYWTSVHGKRIKQGDNRVAQCATCHGAHGIRKVNDSLAPVYPSNIPKLCAGCHADKKLMAEYKIPTNQYEEYIESVHGKALLEKGDVRGAPACNNCHGNHGATPPGLGTIANVCGNCHRHNADLFLASPMAKPLSKEPLGECIACHGKHKIMHTSDDLVGTQSTAVCMKCHKPDEKGAQFAAYVATEFSSYRDSLEKVTKMIEGAGEKGMDITDGLDLIQASKQSLIQARTELHAFSKPVLDAKLKEGRENLKKAEAFGVAALVEFETRRTGLAISTLLLTFLVTALAIKIRRLGPPRS